ncbi:nucleotidyl transferase AbiEii/AbiGii toxin family protein [Prevotella bivia]|uniref:nucleotidyl transferase AbiEii/AbiGii toxin family protein n=1 Tax=Prevotella bivia TaxID=28125 RepID=UPI00374321FD
MLRPSSFMVRCFTLPDLFAGKLHALTFRNWKNRVKGRDWYDFEWYVRQGIGLDYTHLQERIYELNGIEMGYGKFIETLKAKILSTNIEQVKADVLPFVLDQSEIAIWSTAYFLQLVDMIKLA